MFDWRVYLSTYKKSVCFSSASKTVSEFSHRKVREDATAKRSQPLCSTLQDNMSVFTTWKSLVIIRNTNFAQPCDFQTLSKNCEKVTVLSSSCPSVRLHGTTRLLLDGFCSKLTYKFSSKIRGENPSIIKKTNKNDGYFTLRHFHIYGKISLNYF